MKQILFIMLFAVNAQAIDCKKPKTDEEKMLCRIEAQNQEIFRLMLQIRTDRQMRMNAIQRFETCEKICQAIPIEQTADWESTERGQCYKKCEPLRPPGIADEC